MPPVAGGTAATRAIGAEGTQMMPRQTEVIVQEEEDRRPARTSTYIVILAVLLAVLAGLLFLLARTLGVGSSSEVVVPSVVGDTQDVATRKLRDEGLRVTVKSQPNDANEPGKVLDQNPDGGARVREGATVEITVAGEAEQIPVPNVVGQNVDNARDALEDAGFSVSTRQRNDDDAPRNRVLEQSPRANERAARGSTVNLVVSSGPEQVAVPALANVPEADARAELRGLGFNVEQTTAASTSVAAGRVIRTDPAQGTSLERGSTVTLVVSTGPPATTAAPTTTTPPTTVVITIFPTTTSPPTTRPTTSTT